MQAGVSIAVLMPHPPVVIPAVGGRRGHAAAKTMRAMSDCARRVAAVRPDAVVLVSPHSPRRPDAFGLWSGPTIDGSLARFGAPDTAVSFPADKSLCRAVADFAHARRLHTWQIREDELDHGATVPLWYLAEAGWSGPTVVLSLNYPGEGGLEELGRAVAEAARASDRRVAFVASGDMSHRLKPGAPAGFHPRAGEFDRQFIETLRRADYRGLKAIDPDLQELAAEDAVDSTLVAAAAVDWNSRGHEVLSYEGPFGVGYGVAVLFDATADGQPAASDGAEASPRRAGGESLPAIARESVRLALCGDNSPPPAPANAWQSQRCGVFVTIRDRAGRLRGCIGTLTPKYGNIVEETWRMAREAALRDARFAPVMPAEFPSLRFEVSVLHPLEDIGSPAELDPRRYGVVVGTEDGRRGTLLPAIPDVHTVEEQIDIARRKGRIEPWEPVKLQRFTVDKFKDEDFVEGED